MVEQAESLDRVDRVHCPLQREMDVVLLEQEHRLADDGPAIVERELSGALKEVCERHRGIGQVW